MIFEIKNTIFKAGKDFSFITPDCVEYNECKALVIYDCFDIYEIQFLCKNNLSVFNCYIIERKKLEKVMEYCFNCINYNKAISAQHIIKITS